jgi:hypothetical protein
MGGNISIYYNNNCIKKSNIGEFYMPRVEMERSYDI